MRFFLKMKKENQRKVYRLAYVPLPPPPDLKHFWPKKVHFWAVLILSGLGGGKHVLGTSVLGEGAASSSRTGLGFPMSTCASTCCSAFYLSSTSQFSTRNLTHCELKTPAVCGMVCKDTPVFETVSQSFTAHFRVFGAISISLPTTNEIRKHCRQHCPWGVTQFYANNCPPITGESGFGFWKISKTNFRIWEVRKKVNWLY